MATGRYWRVGAAIGSAVVALTVIGCSVGSPSNSGSGVLSAGSSSPSAVPLDSSSPEPSPSASAKPKPKHTKPAPAPTQPPEKTCAGTQGRKLSKAQILVLLKRGAAYQPWLHAAAPTGLTKPLPKIVVPLKLLRAIAFQESGWQTNCIANDGINAGFGLFQISADAQGTWNARFGTNFNRFDPQGNVMLAVLTLQEDIVAFGQNYFHQTYSWSTTKLWDATVAAFNVGRANVDGTGKIKIGPRGTAYYQAVRQETSSSASCQHWG